MNDSAKDKIREGWKEVYPEGSKKAKKDYIPYDSSEAKRKIRDGLQDMFPEVDSKGNPLRRKLTREEKVKLFFDGEEINDDD